jgi:hypothetical protein
LYRLHTAQGTNNLILLTRKYNSAESLKYQKQNLSSVVSAIEAFGDKNVSIGEDLEDVDKAACCNRWISRSLNAVLSGDSMVSKRS